MRDSNYKSITNNKAAVTITTSLYDRRALDVTSDKPLVNSLNHLTYLVSSLAKVRETLSMDGGIERLIEILHECHNLTFNVVDNIFNSERKLLTAWKWTLAFQCLVLIGTRGTEKVRLRVVQAGMLPIIATVLDNYLTIHERSFIYANGDHFTGSQPPQAQPQLQGLGLTSGGHQHHHAHQQRQPAQGISAQQQPQLQAGQLPTHHHQFNRGQILQQHQQQQQQTGQMQLNQFNQQNTAPHTIPPHNIQNLQNIPQQIPLQGQQQQQQQQQQSQEQQRTHDHNAFPEVIPHVSIPELEPSTLSITRPTNSTSLTANDSLDLFNNQLSRIDSYPQNQLSSHFFSGGQNLTSDDYDNLTVEQLFKLIKLNGLPRTRPENESDRQDITSINNDVRRRYLIVNIIQKLRREKENDVLDCSCYNECDYDMDCDLQFLSDMYLQEEQSSNNYSNFVISKIAPRNFTETGVVIPRDDDIVWSLQLLAYISKYPYLKSDLQNTHLVIDMSIRDKQVKLYLEKQLKTKLKKNFLIESRPKAKPKSRKNNNNTAKGDSYVERFRLSPSNSPQMLNDIKDLDEESFVLDDEFAKEQSNGDENRNGNGNGNGIGNGNNNANNETIENDNHRQGSNNSNSVIADGYDEEDLDEQSSDSLLLCGDDDEGTTTNATGNGDSNKIASALVNCGTCSELTENLLQVLHNDIVKAESVSDELERKISLFHVGEAINRTVEVERKQLSEAIMNKREEKLKYLTGRWDYDSYENFDIDSNTQEEDLDFDDSLVEYKKANLFPMVEKFTFLAGTDMYYWAGVIMRNSCRRNEAKGGVRQCGNLECGKWESYPREFLKCRRCKRTKYCSRECQMRAWQCHRNWCIQSTSSSGTAMSSSTTSGPPVPVHAQEPMRVDVMTRPPVGPS